MDLLHFNLPVAFDGLLGKYGHIFVKARKLDERGGDKREYNMVTYLDGSQGLVEPYLANCYSYYHTRNHAYGISDEPSKPRFDAPFHHALTGHLVCYGARSTGGYIR